MYAASVNRIGYLQVMNIRWFDVFEIGGSFVRGSQGGGRQRQCGLWRGSGIESESGYVRLSSVELD